MPAAGDGSSAATNGVTADSTKGLTTVPFPDPAKTGVIPVIRHDVDEVIVGYEVS